MVETPKHQSLSSRWWWLDCPSSIQHKRSPWLQSAIAELDEKTKAMLQLIEEDADSFAQRAEMYYKKRPELITMVEDFYRTHRSLAERFDQSKSESRLSTPRSSSLLSMSKCQPEKLLMGLRSSQKDYDSYSETYELDESDVEDPYEPLIASPLDVKTEWVPFSNGSSDLKRFNKEEIDECEESDVEGPEPEEEEDDAETKERTHELMKLKAEMERLKEENMTQKEQIMQKDEEKREVIRQLSIAIDMLRDENVKLKQRLAATNKDSTPKKKNARGGVEINNKLKNSIWGRIFH